MESGAHGLRNLFEQLGLPGGEADIDQLNPTLRA